MTARKSASALLVPTTPTDPNHATSKSYVDSSISSATSGVNVAMDHVTGLTAALNGKMDKSVIDAKGEIVAGTAANTPGIVTAPSSDGQFLKSASAQATGMTWAALTSSDVGLGNVNNTSDSVKSVASAATLTTPRNIAGVAFDGSAAISLTQDNIGDGSTNRSYTAAEKTKLAAITGTNTGDQTTITGNAGTATKLATARNIDGIAFDGTADIVTGEAVTTSAAASLTLTTAFSAYVFTGSSPTTWTLPAISGNTGKRLIVENRGSAAITLQRAGTDQIWFLAALTNVTIAAGGSMILVNDGTYWNSLSTDLANNSAGVLAVANGGTGVNSIATFLTNYTIATTGGVQTLTNKTITAPVLGGTATGTYTLGGTPTITSPTITGYIESVVSIGTVTTATTINLASGTVQTMTLTNANTCAVTMPTAVAGQSFVLIVKQPATTGSGLVTFGSPTKWPASGTPAMTQGGGKADIFTFFSDGTDWFGNYSQGYTY